MPEPLRISAADGYALGATLYGTERTGPVVLINSATGVKQRFYGRFAAWLAERGTQVVTYDYRGIGASRPHRLRGFAATMSDWGRHDFEGALRFLRGEFPNRALHVLGHSVGGQLLGQAESNHVISRALTVGAQLGAWRLWPLKGRVAMAGLWFVVMPGVAHALGYLPGRLGIGEDLPRGVALEWAKWGRSPGFFLDHGVARAGFERLKAPIVAYSFSDDGYAPQAAVDALHHLFTQTAVERRHLSPASLGAKAIGHFGFFKDTFRESLWAAAAEALARE